MMLINGTSATLMNTMAFFMFMNMPPMRHMFNMLFVRMASLFHKDAFFRGWELNDLLVKSSEFQQSPLSLVFQLSLSLSLHQDIRPGTSYVLDDPYRALLPLRVMHVFTIIFIFITVEGKYYRRLCTL